MIKASHTSFWVRFFNLYTGRVIRRNFADFSFNQEITLQDKPLLVLGNHIGWWDGFFLVQVNRKYFRRRFHVMMLEEELSKRKPLRHAGAYSILKNSRGIIESLSYTTELLCDPGNMVLLFPQGRIHSQYEPQLEFEPGIERVLADVGEIQVLFSVALLDYSSKQKPSVQLYFKEYDLVAGRDRGSLQAAYNDHFHASLKAQREKIRKEHG